MTLITAKLSYYRCERYQVFCSRSSSQKTKNEFYGGIALIGFKS